MRKCARVASDFDALIPSLKRKIDAIISSLSITDKRQQEIAFSDKAARSGFTSDCGKRVSHSADAGIAAEGKTCRRAAGSRKEAYANDNWRALKGAQDVVAYASGILSIPVNRGRLDAALQDEVAASEEGFLKQPAGRVCVAGPSVKRG
ncbi:transporter substrate-binding domain-containing protein [Salmonella enterica subsp. enterica]|nr:transporter substrate-binding domain-containing protein [Salmonella enterica subsp. enterica]